jgi:hypothetical protein
MISLPDGRRAMVGGQWHATIVTDDTDEVMSQWCTGQQGLDENGQPTGGAGYCTILNDAGDVLWVGFAGTAGEPGRWVVLGGTGAWAGATGSGTTTMVSQRADGRAWTSKSEGTITTP